MNPTKNRTDHRQVIREQPRKEDGQYAKRQFCKQWGHDMNICGRDARGHCKDCARRQWRRYYRLKRAPGQRCLGLPHLREMRQMRGLTQGDLALAAGISVVTVENVEAGGKAQRRVRENMADALGVDIRQLVDESEVGRAS